MEKRMVLPTALAVVVALTSLALLILRTLVPGAVLPRWDLPFQGALCLIALALDAPLGHPAKPDWLICGLTGVLGFGLLPLAAGLTTVAQAVPQGLAGGILFLVLTGLFLSLRDRLDAGVSKRLAPLAAAFVLFLACQALAKLF